MKNDISQKLTAQLSELSPDQLNNLIEQARLLRKRSAERETSLDTWVIRLHKKQQRMLSSATDLRIGIVASIFPTHALVELESSIEMAKLPGSQICVGDRVKVGNLSGELGIVQVEPRLSKLSRPTSGSLHREQLIAANLDAVVIVVSVGSPPLHPRLIDRYLVAAQNGNVTPVIVVNKIDLLGDPTELDALEVHRQNGLTVFLCSTLRGDGILQLRSALECKMVAFVGHSGVGKSSLVNAFAPDLALATANVSEGYGRGRHTTTVSSLHRLIDGTVLIDTPGIRSFGLWSVTEDEIDRTFPEIAQLECKFRNCRHSNEPGCGVLGALESGVLKYDRYLAYLRLRKEVNAPT